MDARQGASCLAVLVGVVVVTVMISPVVFARESKARFLNKRSLSKIKHLNIEGPYIGLITVIPMEEDAFLATGAFKSHPKHPFVDLSGRRFHVGKIHGKSVVYVRCGVGMITVTMNIGMNPVNAAATTQQMLDLFNVLGIVHFGVGGNINNSLSIEDVTIPKQFAHTGIWDWHKPNGTLETNDVAYLDIGSYSIPKGAGINLLGRIGYSTEEFYSETGKPNISQPVLWTPISQRWLHLASSLENMELGRCLNLSLCLPRKPKVTVGLRGSTANIFGDNAAYRDFLFTTFGVSSVDMESSAVVMTSLSNGFPVIVIRGLSDLAGGQPGPNSFLTFGPLAALNTAKAVIRFVEILP